MASGNTLCTFFAQDGFALASTNYATLDTRNFYPVLDFDDTTDEEIGFVGFMPRHYAGGGVTVTLGWMATDTTVTPHDAVLQGAFLSVSDDADDLDSKSFAAFQGTGAVAEASASGEVQYSTIAFTDGAQMDSVAAGEVFYFKVRRDADNTSATDSLTNDLELVFVEIKET